MNDITIDRSRFDELVELHCLLELLDFDGDFSFWAGRPELLARQAIPLMHGVDPESWRKYLRDEKGLPDDMARSIEDSLELAEIDGIKKATPLDWLKWGRGHGLHEHALKPDYVNIASEVCLWSLFEGAVAVVSGNNAKAANEPKVYKNKWDDPSTWEYEARKIGADYFEANPDAGVVAIAKHVARVFRGKGACGRKLGFLSWETIKREALTNVTGRNLNGRK